MNSKGSQLGTIKTVRVLHTHEADCMGRCRLTLFGDALVSRWKAHQHQFAQRLLPSQKSRPHARPLPWSPSLIPAMRQHA